ncbi:putative disease resistance protein RGA1 [Brachypodium distachyon]|uniref:Uncharacterized protein n=1 Tax=Brachypodium distachyon TaxID=15368 RepID=I1IHW7_BRADI|nr:putative disease resistance protein RGA1 [Brachypodium distachyon]KQJ86490.1 hypothetical protein BRADI_4g05870v3 [Brachypodium distachyon]|eukprot:XP_003575803.1 putative disease resistance protein RGA1 [Brachypodium distachyon]
MAEFVIGPLISLLKGKASSYLLNQYKVMKGMEEQRGKLERQLQAILGIIKDAEMGSSRQEVSVWLKALKKVSHEAIDVFDEFKYEALRREAKKKGQYTTLGFDTVKLFPSHNPIVFRHRMGKKLQRIVRTVGELVAEMNAFGFKQLQQAPPSKLWRITDSIMKDSEKDIVIRSRDDEKKKIVRILIDRASDEDLMVLPVVGMGGLGKTTFAQLIYDDPEIKKYFQFRRWCCVSDDFDVARIASDLCQTKEENREKALQDLQKIVAGKRYLIVLDDVWDQDADKWEKLKTCLKQGGKGSVVLTTTRKPEVARVMAAGEAVHHLEKLEHKYIKEMIQSRAFSSKNPNTDELGDIVNMVVDRCHGYPLAAKAFGSMLSTKTSMQEWKDVLTKSNICNEKTEILPILKLSYDDLPSHMKQCFAFCALFPKNHEIDVEDLIRLWMANDFISPQDEDRLEREYVEIFEELAWRSFFQDVNQTSPIGTHGKREQLRHRTTCKIHDLMHDIALSVMGEECVTIVAGYDRKRLFSGSSRHIFAEYYKIGSDFDTFLKKQSPTLQTLLYVDSNRPMPCLSKFSSLRALQPLILKELPFRPRHVQHLRYLNFSRNMEIEELPEEISILYNLQTLNLSHCNDLRRLPKGMKYMASLRHLYTNGCQSLECMPPDLGQLASLQTMTYFVVGAKPGCSTVKELQNLNLHGELELCGLQYVSEEDAEAATLGMKEKLTHLSLEWSGDHHEEPFPDCHKKVLDALKPHDGLLMLRIVSYKGTGLPRWATNLTVLKNLVELHLVCCTMCEEFPLFCHLRALQVLHLRRLDKLQYLCKDTVSARFPELRELQLHDLERLERWVLAEGTEEEELTFPLLRHLEIKNCPKLTTLPEAPKLQVLKVAEVKEHLSLLIVKSGYMFSLSELEMSVSDTKAVPASQDLQLCQDVEATLSEMILSGCDFFFPSSPPQPPIGIWNCFGQLIILAIKSCDTLIYWPDQVFGSLVSLKQLRVASCSKLIGPTPLKQDPTQLRYQLLPHLRNLSIFDCGRLRELFILPPSLTYIAILNCSNLEFILAKEDAELEHLDRFTPSEHCNDLVSTSMPKQFPLPRLECLAICSCHKMEALLYLPPSLEHLQIQSCHNLHTVSGQLDGLMGLYVANCNKLESLDSAGDSPLLEDLNVKHCKRLASLSIGLYRYSQFRTFAIEYCPAMNMKPIYERQQQVGSLEHRWNMSRAHSSDPAEGPKWRDPKSWKYAIPGHRYQRY